MTDAPETFRTTRQSLPIMLLRAREEVMGRYRPLLHDIDVTEAQWRVLRVLFETDEIDVTSLAAQAAILGPSLTRILKSLSARGLIAVRRDANDGRRSLASLTDDGRTLVLSAADDSAALTRSITETFGAQRMEKLLAELDALVEALSESR